jgi:hypothetical protein
MGDAAALERVGNLGDDPEVAERRQDLAFASRM